LLSCLSASVFPDFPEVLVDTGIQITQSNPVNPGTPVDTPVLTGREFDGDFQHITKFWNSISLTIRDQNLSKCWKWRWKHELTKKNWYILDQNDKHTRSERQEQRSYHGTHDTVHHRRHSSFFVQVVYVVSCTTSDTSGLTGLSFLPGKLAFVAEITP
jgi:hypothetical protein